MTDDAAIRASSSRRARNLLRRGPHHADGMDRLLEMLKQRREAANVVFDNVRKLARFATSKQAASRGLPRSMISPRRRFELRSLAYQRRTSEGPSRSSRNQGQSVPGGSGTSLPHDAAMDALQMLSGDAIELAKGLRDRRRSRPAAGSVKAKSGSRKAPGRRAREKKGFKLPGGAVYSRRNAVLPRRMQFSAARPDYPPRAIMQCVYGALLPMDAALRSSRATSRRSCARRKQRQ